MDLIPQAKRAFQLQSYAPTATIDGARVVELKRFSDDGGSLTELVRLVDGTPEALAGFTVRQLNYSEMEPGVIKAYHLHARQTDVWYVPPSDRMLVMLLDVRETSPTKNARMRIMLGAGASRLLRIPPGVAHGVRNVGTATGRIIYLTDLHFSPDPAACDEGRLPWDYAGAEVWDVTRG
jgi:dTDP-4-dehydrorhamnose 3,5-epimerase